jgi:anti-sigma B factor antagonist
VLSQHIEPFTCRASTDGDAVIVAPRGELDMATVGAVEQELRRALRAGANKLVLDLRGLSFMDSTGLHLVARWSKDSSRDGFDFELEQGPPAVRRVFELSGMDGQLPFREDSLR